MKSAAFLSAIAAGHIDEFLSASASAAAKDTTTRLSEKFTPDETTGMLTGLLTMKHGQVLQQFGPYAHVAATSLALRAYSAFQRDVRGDITAADRILKIADTLEAEAIEMGPSFGRDETDEAVADEAVA